MKRIFVLFMALAGLAAIYGVCISLAFYVATLFLTENRMIMVLF